MTVLRSMLFVPGDSEKKLAKGASVGADALILDLEDAVAASRRPVAREMIQEYLRAADRTLTDDDVATVRDKCVAAVTKLGASLRTA